MDEFEQKDISYFVAKDTGYSRELVEKVIEEFWKAIRYYITNPLISCRGIMLYGFGKFHMNAKSIRTYMAKGKNKYHHEFYQEILNIIDNEGQTTEQDHDE